MNILISVAVLAICLFLLLKMRKGGLRNLVGIIYFAVTTYWLWNISDWTANGFYDSFLEKLGIMTGSCTFSFSGLYLLFKETEL